MSNEEKDLNVQKNQETPEENSSQQQEITLTPSMLDTEGDENVEVKRDLSAIIPKGITAPSALSETELLQLNSKEKELKTDGAVVLANIKGEDVVDMVLDVTLPEQIDIAKRKEEIQKNKNKKQHKKEPKKRLKTKEQKTLLEIPVLLQLLMTLFLLFS